MADPVSVRPATAGDADAIARVQVETWRAAYRAIVPAAFLAGLDHAERAERWRRGFADPARTAYPNESGWSGCVAATSPDAVSPRSAVGRCPGRRWRP